MSIESIPRTQQSGFYGRHCITGRHVGITNGIDVSPNLDKCVIKKWLWGAYGYHITNSENDILGLLFFQFEDENQAQNILARLDDLIIVNYI